MDGKFHLEIVIKQQTLLEVTSCIVLGRQFHTSRKE